MNRSSKIFRYVSRRLIQGIPIILAIVVLNFFLLNLAEGDAVDVLAGEAGSATPEYMEEMRKKIWSGQTLTGTTGSLPQKCYPTGSRIFIPS